MLPQNNTCGEQNNPLAEAAEPALSIVSDKKVCEIETPSTDQDQASKFIKGLVFALPLSISLWAFMLIGLRAIL